MARSTPVLKASDTEPARESMFHTWSGQPAARAIPRKFRVRAWPVRLPGAFVDDHGPDPTTLGDTGELRDEVGVVLEVVLGFSLTVLEREVRAKRYFQKANRLVSGKSVARAIGLLDGELRVCWSG